MKLAVVTGASAGIGFATAARFQEAGYAVANLSRRPCALPGVVNACCDISEPDFLDAVAPRLAPLFEDAAQVALIHNAARLDHDTASGTEAEELRAVLEVNVVAAGVLNRFAIPLMRPGSCILYVGSTLSEQAVAGAYSYVVSKHAQLGMMRACCQDLAGQGIHTACVCPGFTDTEMLRAHIPEQALDGVRRLSAFGRLVEPGEIAAALLWAAGSPVVNGSAIHANLGQLQQ